MSKDFDIEAKANEALAMIFKCTKRIIEGEDEESMTRIKACEVLEKSVVNKHYATKASTDNKTTNYNVHELVMQVDQARQAAKSKRQLDAKPTILIEAKTV